MDEIAKPKFDPLKFLRETYQRGPRLEEALESVRKSGIGSVEEYICETNRQGVALQKLLAEERIDPNQICSDLTDFNYVPHSQTMLLQMIDDLLKLRARLQAQSSALQKHIHKLEIGGQHPDDSQTLQNLRHQKGIYEYIIAELSRIMDK
jgi:hypothetical protein